MIASCTFSRRLRKATARIESRRTKRNNAAKVLHKPKDVPVATATVPHADSVRTINADDRRWLAEEADGKRGQRLGFKWDEEEKKFQLVPEDQSLESAPFVLHTRFESTCLRGDDVSINVRWRGKTVTVPREADAIFLTESAVEKFVFPYYTRMLSPRQIQELKTELFGTGAEKQCYVVAFHIPPSLTKGGAAPIQGLNFNEATGDLSPRACRVSEKEAR